jgi:hypothetical protein
MRLSCLRPRLDFRLHSLLPSIPASPRLRHELIGVVEYYKVLIDRSKGRPCSAPASIRRLASPLTALISNDLVRVLAQRHSSIASGVEVTRKFAS